jgi:hypothetical protein
MTLKASAPTGVAQFSDESVAVMDDLAFPLAGGP